MTRNWPDFVFQLIYAILWCVKGFISVCAKIARDEKDSILANVPGDLKEKGSELYASLIDGKVS